MTSNFFTDLGDIITEKAKVLEDKTEEFMSVQKIKAKKSSLERDVTGKYQEIGKLVYDSFEQGEVYPESIADLCAKIDNLYGKIRECQEELDRKKA